MYESQEEFMFQFLIVRLKYVNWCDWQIPIHVSIPYSTIKIEKSNPIITT